MVIGVHSASEHRYAGHGCNRVRNGVDDACVAAFREVRYAFDQAAGHCTCDSLYTTSPLRILSDTRFTPKYHEISR